ncbi:ferredoxin-NADP reductase [Murinocardiopsis flavida]|uniref:nitric oxide dioxygenase n=2 Tax=Murinocardiopsis flavida TaxID=645275 RepID=A0A2P8DSH7_9ACTN|nr:ferredoxin-NADP reductase [Murinocardiopsis flavida]
MPLNPRLVRATFECVERDHAASSGYFYGRLFAEHPRLRALFPPAMDVQRDRLFDALTTIVCSLDDPESLVRYLGRLGRDHRRFGVAPAHYEAVGSALLATVARAAGDQWTAEAAAAWRDAFALASRMMIEAAAEHAAWAPPWWQAEVVALERPRHDLARITLRPDQPYPYLPGQYLMVQVARWPRVWRPYSIANAPRGDNLLRLVVRAVPGGWVSTALVAHTRPGDRLLLGAPLGTTVLDAESDRDLVMVAGGSGIAPIKAIAEQVAALPRRRPMLLLYGAGEAAELTESADLAALQSTYPWLRVVEVLGRGADERRAAEPAGDHASAEVASGTAVGVLGDYGPLHGSDAFVCGPDAMVRAAVPRLVEAGVDPERIRHDLLPHDAEGAADAAPAKRPGAHADGGTESPGAPGQVPLRG